MDDGRSKLGRVGLVERAVILAEGRLAVFGAKTASCIIRYAAEEVVAVIDSTKAGQVVSDVLGFGDLIPVVASVSEALQFEPKMLIVGIAPIGGGLPKEYRRSIKGAITAGLHIISGLHHFLSEDAELSELAKRHSVKLIDVRRPPSSLTVSKGESPFLPVFRILTVGTDCSVGKMVVAWEVANALKEEGLNACFCATGQTGIILAGSGIPVDRVVSDFIAGATETLVKTAFDADIAVVEGQGSIYHPAYSGVTLGMLHGSAPNVMILCHHYGRTHIKEYGVPIPPLKRVIADYEWAASLTHPSKVVGVALNTVDTDYEVAKETCSQLSERLSLPITDCIRFGAKPLVKRIVQEYGLWKSHWKS